MRKSVEKVLGSFKMEGSSFYQARRGFKGDPVDPEDLHGYVTSILIGPRRGKDDPAKVEHLERCLTAEEAVKNRFDYTLTKANYKDVIEAYEFGVAACAKDRPVIDERRTRSEDEELQKVLADRSAKDRADRAVKDAIADEVRSLAPVGSTHVIVAQLKVDKSDIQTDYFHNQTVRTVVIGFQSTGRTDFRKLHRAAAQFPETAHLGDQEALTAWLLAGNGWGERGCGYVDEHAGEHRDNFSMGSGNYLSDHGYDGSGSGWRVSTVDLGGSYPSVTEIADYLKVGVSA